MIVAVIHPTVEITESQAVVMCRHAVPEVLRSSAPMDRHRLRSARPEEER